MFLCLFGAWCLVFGSSRPVFSQGILPGEESKPRVQVSSTTVPYLLIGEQVPSKWTVIDPNGETRSLTSYTPALDIMVIGFLSSDCPYHQTAWRDLKRYYDFYKGWKVSFVGVLSGKGMRVQDTTEAMAKAGLDFPLLRDKDGEIARALKVTGIPEIVILDEDAMLRYRGALHDSIQTPAQKPKRWPAREAIEAVIGHVDPVPEAEPTLFIGCPWP